MSNSHEKKVQNRKKSIFTKNRTERRPQLPSNSQGSAKHRITTNTARPHLSWFKDYLTNRQQSTRANGFTSLPRVVQCGVPQGSILGPLLFLVYINDLPTSLDMLKCQLYADDTALYTSFRYPTPDIVERVNVDLLNVANWCKKNKLSLNLKKTKYTIYGTRQRLSNLPHLKLSIDGQNLLQNPHYRYLGMELDSKMNFKAHRNIAQKSLSYKSYLTSKLRYGITKDAALDIVNTMILPALAYGHLIYGAGNKGALDKLQNISNRLLRLCFFLRRDTPLTALRIESGISTLELRRAKALANESFKFAQNPVNQDNRLIHTRAHDALLVKIPHYKTKTARQSVAYQLAYKWNSFDVKIRAIDSPMVFRNKVNEIYTALLS